MPAKLSKFVVDNARCKDFVHPWIDSCLSAQAGLGLHALQESLRIYSTVYFITLLMRGKIPSKNDITRTVLGILQSTAFLSWSAFTYPMFICGLRNMLGNFNILTVSFLPSFLSSFLAILIERPSRRTLLCLYVANIASETLFRMGVWRGYFNPVPHGNVYIFAMSMAALLYFLRSNTPKTDSIFKIIRFIVSPHEDPAYVKTINSTGSETVKKKSDVPVKKSSLNIILQSIRVYENLINSIKNRGKHVSCPHPNSCAYFILSGPAKLFSIGLGAQLGIKILFQFKRLIAKPSTIKDALFKRDNLNLALFLSGFSAIYRLTSCALRRVVGADSSYHAIPAGLLASTAFVLFPNNTIALYVMWKALQLMWNKGVESKKLPEVKWFVVFFYCFSTAILFHAAIMEPQNLRGSYWKFLCNLSGGRVAAMSRNPLDGFGLESAKYLQEVLIKTKTTDQFKYSF